jgi:hypothetical protein
MTADELVKFQTNPNELHGSKFALRHNTGNLEMYEVIGYHKKRDKSVEYEVLFESIPQHPIIYDAKDMEKMLWDSYYIPM